MAAATFVQSVGSATFGAFGAVALLIAAVGMYGVMASEVATRRRDTAVRLALGASPWMVLSAVAGPALRLATLGLLVGALLTLLASPLLRSQLVSVSPVDAVSIITGAAVLVLTTVAACVWPAWSALRIDPVTALRSP